MNQFYKMKGIKREFSVARTPQQNKVAERKNRTLIEAARTMLADLNLPTTFWAEAVNTACYVQNRVLVIKPYNKTPYKLFLGRKPSLSFMRPFGYLVTILNTIDHLGKFDGKANEGLFIGYYTNSKAFRVFNNRTKIVEENLDFKFSENTPNIVRRGPNWLFDIDALTKSMNYKPVVARNQYNGSAGTKTCDNVVQRILFVLDLNHYWKEKKDVDDLGNEDSEVPSIKEPRVNQEKDANVNIINNINIVSPTDNVAGIEDNVVDENIVYGYVDDPNMPDLEEIGRFGDGENDDSGADMNNLDTYFSVSPIPTIRIHKDHPLKQVIKDLHSAPQTKRMNKLDERGIVIRNKERLVAQGHTQEEDIDHDEVFAPVAKIKAIRSTRKDMCTEFEMMMHKKLQMSSMGELTFFLGLQVKQKEDKIFISQDKYVNEILNKFSFSDVKTASTPVETHKTLLKDEKGEDVDEHLYRSMIGSLMYLTSSRPDIIYLKGQPKLGLWYPKDSPFDLVAYTISDYAGASLDRKSTTRGCQFLGCRLISWQCKKQTVVANSTTKADTGFEQIIDFLNAHPIKYALTINATIYTSCIEQFWTTTTAKNINGEEQLHAKVDGKKVVTSEASIMRDLRFGDGGGIDCLPNETIFEQLLLMGTIASAVICLATDQKFNSSKYIFDSIVKNLYNATKFLMFPRFVQVFLNNQLEEMANHIRIYVPPSHTKKIFRNMKRVGKGFSGRDTPLFPHIMVQAQEELGEDIEILTETHPIPIITQPSTSKP
nr:ribonuclease H-like domain-containing protein [Tanacetum cinerariifolium]